MRSRSLEDDPVTIRLTEVDGLFPSVPYAYATTVPAGSRLAFLAGSCPLDAEGRTVAQGDHAGQARACMENLRATLSALGATLEDVVFVRVLAATTTQPDLVTVWDVVHDAFGDHEPPGTLMGVTVLGWEHQLVEVEAVARIKALEHDLG